MPKKKASDIEALRWREMFQAAITGICTDAEATTQNAVTTAAQVADLGLREFYARYEREK